jgi:hypothetical protein
MYIHLAGWQTHSTGTVLLEKVTHTVLEKVAVTESVRKFTEPKRSLLRSRP